MRLSVVFFGMFTAAEYPYHVFIFHETFDIDITLLEFYMVWKSYCKQFFACQKQLLVSDYSLN